MRLSGGGVYLTDNLYAALDRAGHRTGVRVEPQYSLYLLAVPFLSAEVECLLYPLEDENLVLCFYLPYCVSVEVIEGNLTRCQRAPKGTKQSTACSSHQVIQSRGMRFFYLG